MASYVTPKYATAFITYVGLLSQADTKLLQVNPTLATGDVKVSIDGGAFANLATLPVVTPAGGRGVKLALSSTEMTGDNITVVFVDAAGAEWCDLLVNIQTSVRQIDDLATAAALTVVDDFLDTEVAAILAAVDTEVAAIKTITDQFVFGTANRVNAQVFGIEAGAVTAAAVATGAIDADALATDAVVEIADGILNRDLSTGSDSGSPTVRTVRQALRFLRNKWAVVAGTLTVYKEDDSTASWTAAVTGTTGADPTTSVDPAGP